MVWKKPLRFEDGLQSVDRVYVVKVGELFKKIMIIRCPVVKSPLLKCCTATPNIPVSHSQPSSIWFLDYWRTGSVMVGTSDLSAAMLFAPPPHHHGTPDKTSYCHIGCDHINKNKPVCYQGELEEDFAIILHNSNVISPDRGLCCGLRCRCFLGCLSRIFVSSH